MARKPDFIFEYGGDIQDFARLAKVSNMGGLNKSISSNSANRFWGKITVEEIVDLVTDLEVLVDQYRSDIEGFKVALARFQSTPKKRWTVNAQIIENMSEPVSALVLEINTWRVAFDGDTNILGNPASMRRSTVVDGRMQEGAANAVAVWLPRALRSGATEFLTI